MELIPKSVTSIGNGTFSDCRSLISIDVSSENPKYSSVDGVLYNKDMTEIIFVPKGIKGAFFIPSGVTRIGERSFEDCNDLTYIKIPKSVNDIGDYAFSGCKDLGVVILSNEVHLGKMSFDGCKSVTYVK